MARLESYLLLPISSPSPQPSPPFMWFLCFFFLRVINTLWIEEPGWLQSMVLQANLASKRPPPGGGRPEPLEWGLLTSLHVQILPLTKLRSTAGIRICLTFTIVKPQIPWRPHLTFSAECLKSAQHTSILGLSLIPKVHIKLSFNYFGCVGPLCQLWWQHWQMHAWSM